MHLTRRDFLELAIVTGAFLTADPVTTLAKMTEKDLLSFKSVGNVTLLFTTDLHAHLKPLYFAEPANLVPPKPLEGIPGYVTGKDFLRMYRIAPNSLEAYFGSCVNFVELAHKFGKMGGAAHITTIIKQVIAERGRDKVLILDGGDTWVTTAIGLFTEGKAVVDWMNYTGYDLMVGHWDFTLGKEKFLQRVKEFKGEFISQNVVDADFGDLIFKPYSIREVGGVKVGVIGNSFPFTPIANPREFVEGWSFGVREEQLQKFVNELREKHKVDLVVLLSHDGLPLDIALAKKVKGIDIIISGHTHDVTPLPYFVGNTMIVIAGSHGKYVGRLDLDVKDGKIRQYRFKLYPVASNLIPADRGAEELVRKAYAPYEKKLSEVIGVAHTLLYKRDTFFSTWDRLVGEAIADHYHGVDIVTSPGYRWGTTILPGQKITVEHVYDFTAITYPNVYILKRTGEQLLALWEDVADNVFNPDPFYQQGGDMSRLYNVEYEIEINAPQGKRIKRVWVKGKELDPKREYLVAVYGGPTPPPEIRVPDAKPVPVYQILIDYIRKKRDIHVDPRPNVRVLDAKYVPPYQCYGGKRA
ncbi:5'-Nucleotidase domain protein [Thermocrinis albus DSM 14484]|uniref:5'-Nucleotidase domain protein n=1 Tax=Thermocrinis albus (strain DSM 14484 / JCM 11386 / HI 11/12) TaxID=638303 RepID=D3SQF9_THEAH|nr:thiosulfohydrolase SoxB [Thermocrinis albus]ADC89396.1 5'-Nucleotidase domain protein [Thermocrinis albus DSM 14484]